MNKELNARTEADSSTTVQDNSVRQPCTKPNVVRRLEEVMSKFGEAHNMMARTKLPKEEYQPISSLMATAKAELFNIYYELKN